MRIDKREHEKVIHNKEEITWYGPKSSLRYS